MRIIVTIVAAVTFIGSASAQDKELIDALQKLDVRVFKPDSADAKLRWDSVRKMREDVNRKDVEAWRAIKTKADWEKFRDERLAALRKSLGTFPAPPKEVKVVVTKKLPGEGFTVENIIYESRPGFYVTANLYVPEKTDKPMPGFIIIHSHHNPKTQGELQDMGMNWARQGCLVQIPDMLGHGERRQHPFVDGKSFPEKFEVSRQDYRFRYNSALQLHLVGESLMGWMVWDLMRGVDVLYQRPNLDKSKVMVFGSVAGGGDPCAVFAALDKRVTAAAPFNFGGPQPETGKLADDAELNFNYMGGGSWESTRNLKLSGRDGFLPWLIVGSIAPRGLIYGHEFAWDEKRDPVWARFQKIWGFYDAADKLASSHGSGSVRGKPPESTHCNNIGAVHRKPMYPTLNKWFGLPVIETEYKKRFDSSELQCWTDEARRTLKPKMLHEVLQNLDSVIPRKPDPDKDHVGYWRKYWLQVLGISKSELDELQYSPESKIVIDRLPRDGPPRKGPDAPTLRVEVEKIVIRHKDKPTLAVPMVILTPPHKAKLTRVVVGIAQGGKAGFLKHRAETIAELLRQKCAVCLVDLRGTGETAADGRGRQSGGTGYSATLLMHGQTVPGLQLLDLTAVMQALPKLGYKSISLWGDSFVEPNDPKMTFAVPMDVSKMPRQSEPMGATLTLLGRVFGSHHDNVTRTYVRGGLLSYRSMLDGPFLYVPHDAVIPGTLRRFGEDYDYDIRMVARKIDPPDLKMEALVDGLNRRIDQKMLERAFDVDRFGPRVSAEPSSPAEVAAFLSGRAAK